MSFIFDPYALLGLEPNAPIEAIHAAYDRLALLCHPAYANFNSFDFPMPGLTQGEYWERLNMALSLLTQVELREPMITYHRAFGTRGHESPVPDDSQQIVRFDASASPPSGGYVDPMAIFRGVPFVCIRITLEEMLYGTVKHVAYQQTIVHGDQTTVRLNSFCIRLHPGVFNLHAMWLGDQGNIYNGRPGGLVCCFLEDSHPLYTRLGSDLYTQMYVPLQDALLHDTIRVQAVGNKQIALRLIETFPPGMPLVKRIVGEGMPLADDPSIRGDLIVTIFPCFPSVVPYRLRPEIRRLLNQLQYE